MARFEQLLSDSCERFGDDIAVVGARRQVSYRELEQLALASAARLRANGARPEKVTVVLVENSLAFLVGYFGAIMSGAIVAPLSPTAPARELAAILEVTKPTAAVVARRLGDRDMASELAGLLPDGTIWIDDPDVADWPFSSDRSVVVPRDPAESGFLAFTSGSTGRPKGARHRNDTLIHSSENLLHNVLEDGAVVSASTFPMWNMGGICMIVPVLMGGGTIVVLERFSAPGLVRSIEEHKVSFAVATPAMVELMFIKGDLDHHDVSSFNRVLLCAAPISTKLCTTVTERLGAKAFIAYGLTEVPGGWLTTRPDTPPEEIGPFVGWPMDGYELSIRDDDGVALAAGSIGEVWVRTAYMLSEYIDDPVTTANAVDAEGWMHTGDLGMLRDDGGLAITGRKKDMYIRGGYNVYPREVEEALVEHPAIDRAVVHGVDDPVLSERGHAWIVLAPGEQISTDGLRAFLLERLAYYKVPDSFQFVDELPMNTAGKIDRIELRRRAAGSHRTT